MVRALQETLAGQRNRFDGFWEHVTQDAKDAGADEPILPRSRWSPRRLDNDHNSPKDRYSTWKDCIQSAFHCRHVSA